MSADEARQNPTAEYHEVGRSGIKIETNSKGLAQVKLNVLAGETEAEMERLSLLALKVYDEMQNALGRRARFE